MERASRQVGQVVVELKHEVRAVPGCDLLQGYLYAQPLPGEEFSARFLGK